jgi:hypothetical protein
VFDAIGPQDLYCHHTPGDLLYTILVSDPDVTDPLTISCDTSGANSVFDFDPSGRTFRPDLYSALQDFFILAAIHLACRGPIYQAYK